MSRAFAGFLDSRTVGRKIRGTAHAQRRRVAHYVDRSRRRLAACGRSSNSSACTGKACAIPRGTARHRSGSFLRGAWRPLAVDIPRAAAPIRASPPSIDTWPDAESAVPARRAKDLELARHHHLEYRGLALLLRIASRAQCRSTSPVFDCVTSAPIALPPRPTTVACRDSRPESGRHRNRRSFLRAPLPVVEYDGRTGIFSRTQVCSSPKLMPHAPSPT